MPAFVLTGLMMSFAKLRRIAWVCWGRVVLCGHGRELVLGNDGISAQAAKLCGIVHVMVVVCATGLFDSTVAVEVTMREVQRNLQQHVHF